MDNNELCGGLKAEKLAAEIAKNLGIKHCRKLVITMERGEIFTVEASLYPEIDGVKSLVPIMKKFNLQVNEVAEISELGDEYDSFDFKKPRDINGIENGITVDIKIDGREIANVVSEQIKVNSNLQSVIKESEEKDAKG